MIKSTSLSRFKEKTYTLPKGTKPIELTCGHIAFYLPPLPAPGTDAFCRTCKTWTRRKRDRKKIGRRPSNVDGRRLAGRRKPRCTT